MNRKLNVLSTCLDASEEKTLLHPLEVEPRFLGHPARNLFRIRYPMPGISHNFFMYQSVYVSLTFSHSGDSVVISFTALLSWLSVYEINQHVASLFQVILLTKLTVCYAIEKLRYETLMMCKPQDTLVSHVPIFHSVPITILSEEHFSHIRQSTEYEHDFGDLLCRRFRNDP
jgi:hypothetical protein